MGGGGGGGGGGGDGGGGGEGSSRSRDGSKSREGSDEEVEATKLPRVRSHSQSSSRTERDIMKQEKKAFIDDYIKEKRRRALQVNDQAKVKANYKFGRSLIAADDLDLDMRHDEKYILMLEKVKADTKLRVAKAVAEGDQKLHGIDLTKAVEEEAAHHMEARRRQKLKEEMMTESARREKEEVREMVKILEGEVNRKDRRGRNLTLGRSDNRATSTPAPSRLSEDYYSDRESLLMKAKRRAAHRAHLEEMQRKARKEKYKQWKMEKDRETEMEVLRDERKALVKKEMIKKQNSKRDLHLKELGLKRLIEDEERKIREREIVQEIDEEEERKRIASERRRDRLAAKADKRKEDFLQVELNDIREKIKSAIAKPRA